MVKSPFHDPEVGVVCKDEFLTPAIPWKGLDMAVNRWRQPTLHEPDPMAHRPQWTWLQTALLHDNLWR